MEQYEPAQYPYVADMGW